jgi:hypothetical protein
MGDMTDEMRYDDDEFLADDAEARRLLAEAVHALGPVPEPPRDAIWAGIDAERAPRRFRRRTLRFLSLGVALAAMLTLGIGLGRIASVRQPAAPGAPVAGVELTNAALPFRLAAVQHLSRTEALLAELPASARDGRADEVAGWAGDLLGQTRLLLDSPAADDPELARLLGDLELLLAQIAALDVERSEEVELIEDGIERNDVMLRLRTATARTFTGI